MTTALTPKGARAQAAILDVAERAFGDAGLHGASIRDIATAAGIPKASLLHHFPRKESLYDAVLTRIAVELESLLTAALGGDASPPAKLKRLAGRFAGWAQRSPGRCRLLLRELLDNPSRIEQAGRLHLAPVVHLLTGFIREGQRAGDFRDVDPLMFVVHLAGSTSYFIAAHPTLSRIAQRTLHRRFRRDLQTLMRRYLLVNELN